MVELSLDDRGATSVVGLMLLLAVTVIIASTVAVFAFGVGTDDVTEAAEDILDMDDNVDSLLPLIVPASRFGRSRESASADSRDPRAASRPSS